MSNKTNTINYTSNDKLIYSILSASEKPLTLAEMSAVAGQEIKSGHIVSAKNKLIVVDAGEVETTKLASRKVATYNFVTDAVLKNEKGEPFNRTDGETKILAVAATLDQPFTLAELATALGVEKLSSGSINSLVKKGNISKGDQVTVKVNAKSTVKVYAVNPDFDATKLA